jgi:superfamily II DNA or RNA helicase
VNLNVSDMIKDGYLSKPTFYLYPVAPVAYPRHVKFADVYQDYIVDNDERNHLIVSIAKEQVKAGKSVYIHVKIIRHGKTLQQMLPDSMWISGKDKLEVRTAAIENFRRNGGCLISTLLSEGVDVPELDVLIMACGGLSKVFVRQIVGRVLRITADKKQVIIIDFMDCCHHLATHAAERKEIYMSEPAFDVKEEY